MLPRRLLHAACGSLVALAVLTTAFHARSQTPTIAITTSGISRTAPRRTDPVSALWISRADCLANDVLTFPLIVTDFTGTLEVWASNGADCRPPEARNSSVAQCWKVFSGAATNTVTPQIPIRVQDIAAMQKPPEFAQSVGTEASCTPPAGTSSAAQPLTLFFMSILGDMNQGGATWETKLDLVGPAPPNPPPSGTDPLGVGNTLLVPAWSSTGDIDVTGYDFFCAAVDADAAAAQATPVTTFGPGVAVDAGSEAATSSCPDGSVSSDASDDAASDAGDAACVNNTSTPASTTPAPTDASALTQELDPNCDGFNVFTSGGASPSANDLKFLCGSAAGPRATSTTITGLTNFTKYEVAIGAVDAVGNVGPLTAGRCATPQPTVGFAENYHSAGGTAGGGFCAMGRVPPVSPGWRWAVLPALGALVWRRRRSRRVVAAFDRSPAQ
jgi:hypothetical protein